MTPTHSRIQRIQLWVHDRSPYWLRQRAHATFLAALCVFAGLPLITGITESNSLNVFLPGWAVRAWGLSLVVGSLAHLWGITSVHIIDSTEVIRRPAVYKFGLKVCSIAGLLYVLALFTVAGVARSAIPAALVLAWVASNVMRLNEITVAEVTTRLHSDEGG